MKFFPKESIFRRLPKALDQQQRLTLDAICRATDFVGLSYSRMRTAALRFSLIDEIGEDAEAHLKLSMLSDAWSITNNTLVLKRLASRIPTTASDHFSNFLSKNNAEKLRNHLNHLDDRIHYQEVASKQFPGPAYGTLSWSFVKSELEIQIIAFAIGAFPDHASTQLVHQPPYGTAVDFRCSNFHLDAGGNSLNLCALISEVRSLAEFIDTEIGAALRNVSERKAQESDLTIEQALEPAFNGLQYRLVIKPNTPDNS